MRIATVKSSLLLVGLATVLPWFLFFLPMRVHNETSVPGPVFLLFGAYGIAVTLKAYRKDLQFYSRANSFALYSKNELPIRSISELNGYQRMFIHYPFFFFGYSTIASMAVMLIIRKM